MFFMQSQKHQLLKTDAKGVVYIDRDPKLFRMVMRYIKNRKSIDYFTSDLERELLIKELNFWNISHSFGTIKAAVTTTTIPTSNFNSSKVRVIGSSNIQKSPTVIQQDTQAKPSFVIRDAKQSDFNTNTTVPTATKKSNSFVIRDVQPGDQINMIDHGNVYPKTIGTTEVSPSDLLLNLYQTEPIVNHSLDAGSLKGWKKYGPFTGFESETSVFYGKFDKYEDDDVTYHGFVDANGNPSGYGRIIFKETNQIQEGRFLNN